MRIFRNLLFIIESSSKNWSRIGFKIKLNERVITIKPIHLRKTDQKDSQTIIMSAEIVLNHPPKISKENVVFLPKEDDSELSNALKFYSNLISVSDGCKVNISSPTPSSGFIPENEDEKNFLDATNGFPHRLYAQPGFTSDFFEAIYEDQLLDRVDGVAFMAIANNQNNSLGKFHEYIRLFENAFVSNSVGLAKLLFDFLSQNKDFDYSQDEIIDWMIDKRDGATHADQRKKFVFAEDLNKDIDRIKQAAYDVLFNKEKWNSTDTARRKLFEFRQGLKRDGMFLKRREEDKTIRISSDDETFYDPGVELEEEEVNKFVPPKEWWVKYSNSDGKTFKTEFFKLDVK